MRVKKTTLPGASIDLAYERNRPFCRRPLPPGLVSAQGSCPPRHPRVHQRPACNLLGMADVRRGEDAKAVPVLLKALDNGFYGDVHYQLYVAYRKLGKTDLAERALARSQELRRDSAAEHQAMITGVKKVE